MSGDFTFEVNLDKLIDRYSSKSILPDFEIAILQGLENGYEELYFKTIDKLYENLSLVGLDGSRLANSQDLDVELHSDGISLSLGGDYAIYVEYGTGVVGRDSPHPDPSKFGWIYDINNRGEKGWWYPSSPNDPNPTAYMNDLGKWWAWTKGQASRPFMYLTWRWLVNNGTDIINKHVNREFEKLESEYR